MRSRLSRTRASRCRSPSAARWGRAGATLSTTVAGEALAPSWRQTVAAECGGAGAARVPVPAARRPRGARTSTSTASISTCRARRSRSCAGARKTAPPSAPAAPRGGDLDGVDRADRDGKLHLLQAGAGELAARLHAEPDRQRRQSGRHRLLPDLGQRPLRRRQLEGHRPDRARRVHAPATVGLPRPVPAREGRPLRRARRVPGAAPASASHFALALVAHGGATPAPVPATALYPMAQSVGSGLGGRYYAGFLPADPTAAPLARTTGAVDYLWTGKNEPAVGSGCRDSRPPRPCPGSPSPTPSPRSSRGRSFRRSRATTRSPSRPTERRGSTSTARS